ncbi:hypothetical protein E3Q23_02460 [Wallemia mellicola]|uniref:TauD-domain-containing protein n=1 Tax=Wallemia mellicola TaxID=1708541 RepID=A0A4T0LXU3_9BASI|nr:hypothetical protein E3Q23_02460 [Wallemia mellicola]TIB83731.1 TauD-domain-containing protein [Wallemia mellicola]TIB86742.1 TauD-domain-containing protein [Wallemia mellicola]TIB99686.1 TauD-domain-containing protein [Wallemia mellicola]TIC06405.1 TauD-domain-containing protein [Wallemia mellicola]
MSATKTIQETAKHVSAVPATFNPFYSHDPTTADDENYEYNFLKPSFPDVKWAPLELQDVTDRGFSADKSKKNLLSAATKVDNIEPSIGTELSGINIYELTDAQKDELALLAAERTVVILRDQPIDIHKQLDAARYYGPLHKHATTSVPKQEGLEEVHVIYSDGAKRPDPAAFTKTELFHSDVTYELQPPSTTILQVLTAPTEGGSTIWSSGYAAYDSYSNTFQQYLETLYASHSAHEQYNGSLQAGTNPRREPITTLHPVVRVHPVTGWKSIFVQPGFTRSLFTKKGDNVVPIPKHESDHILNLLYRQIADQVDSQVKVRWGKGDIVVWDNRVSAHAATFNTWPQTRLGVRSKFFHIQPHDIPNVSLATPHGEKPRSVEEHNALNLPSGLARSRQEQVWKEQGLQDTNVPVNLNKAKGYSD